MSIVSPDLEKPDTVIYRGRGGATNLPAPVDQLFLRLRCPECHHAMPMSPGKAEISCARCNARFPVLNGKVPVLLRREQRARFAEMLHSDPDAARMAAAYRRYGTWREKPRRVLRPPSIVYDEDVVRRYSWIYDTRGEETVILSIGGGPGRENPRVINLNIEAFDSVDLVGDGLELPLQSESADTVTGNAVIEHVSDPFRLVSEMHRVLKAGGYLQLMVPFMFPFHAYPSDYQRFSRRGVEELTRDLEQVELCILTGPTSAMLVFFREYFRLLVPGGNSRALKTILNGITGWLTFPLKYLDLGLNRKPAAAHLAAAFYYLGRKRGS